MAHKTKEDGWETHPNNFEVFEVMKKEQALSEMKLEQLELGGSGGMLLEKCGKLSV